MTTKKLSVQDIIFTLEQYWAKQGCMLMQAYDTEKGAGTMSPYTFLRAIGPEPWNAAYVEPSRRPADGRYGENPNRLYQHHQFQVIMKPSPDNIQDLYLGSLRELGIEPLEHDIRFVEDNWENPSMGCAGVGWEIWLDGMEVTQFTYFQVVGELPMSPVASEVPMVWNGWLNTSKTLILSTTWNGQTGFSTVIYSRNQNMNTPSTPLKRATRRCFFKPSTITRLKLSA